MRRGLHLSGLLLAAAAGHAAAEGAMADLRNAAQSPERAAAVMDGSRQGSGSRVLASVAPEEGIGPQIRPDLTTEVRPARPKPPAKRNSSRNTDWEKVGWSLYSIALGAGFIALGVSTGWLLPWFPGVFGVVFGLANLSGDVH